MVTFGNGVWIGMARILPRRKPTLKVQKLGRAACAVAAAGATPPLTAGRRAAAASRQAAATLIWASALFLPSKQWLIYPSFKQKRGLPMKAEGAKPEKAN